MARTTKVPLRQLRRDAIESMRRAKNACAQAQREARIVARTRCDMISAAELRAAKEACERMERAAHEAQAAYLRARGEAPKSQRRARERKQERVQWARENAAAHVVAHCDTPGADSPHVAEHAVRIAERELSEARRLPPPTQWERRAEVLAERACHSDVIADAYRRLERDADRAARRDERELLKEYRREVRARRHRRAQPDVVVLDEADVFEVPF